MRCMGLFMAVTSLVVEPKVGRRKEIIKIRAEIKETRYKKTIGRDQQN